MTPDALNQEAARLIGVLGKHPNHVESINNLAAIRRQQGYIDAAIAGFQLAINLRPELAALHYNLGNALVAADRLEDAEAEYQKALTIQPNFPELRQNLGDLYLRWMRFDEAIENYQHSLIQRPHHPGVYCNLGLALHRLGWLGQARAAFEQAYRLHPYSPEILTNLGSVLKDQGFYGEAEQAFRSAIQLQSEHLAALVNLGQLLSEQRRTDEAIALFQRALDVAPEHAVARSSLIHQLQSSGSWETLEANCQQLIAQVERTAYPTRFEQESLASPLTFIGLAVPTSLAQQVQCARHWATQSIPRVPACHQCTPDATRLLEPKRIRVGYLSADFSDFPVGYLIAEVLEEHNRAAIEVFGYSLGPGREHAVHHRIQKSCDTFRYLHQVPTQPAVEMILKDQIDILIDLQGYSFGSRPEILARRPAPIQVNFLGYPGTMGAEFIDYMLVDRYVAPSRYQDYFTEKLVHLPGCILPYDSHRGRNIAIPDRRTVGLPDEVFVFCAFSMTYKIAPAMFQCWMRILRRVPGSVLWLRNWNEDASRRLRAQAADVGISPDRLIFAPYCSLDEHLARQAAADLYLDTFPYNQHSTAADALRAGVPLLTLSGDTIASRVAGSLLTQLGCHELIATSFVDYEAKAVHFAEAPDSLKKLRNHLQVQARSSELWSGRAFAEKLEQVYRALWERYHQGLPPQAILIS